ncbi:hypothetical protein ACMFMG_004145 [Clarireedia jacksonii]
MGNSISGPWKEMMEAKEYSDLTIKCQLKTFYVHRVIVCSQSSVIKAAIDWGAKDSVTTVLRLDDNDPEDVERMIRSIYQQFDDYEEAQCPLICVQDYLIAEKFHLSNMKEAAEAGYIKLLIHRKGCCTSSFLASLELILDRFSEVDRSMTGGGMYGIAVAWAALHMDELKDTPVFKNLCKNNADFTMNVMAAMTDIELQASFTKIHKANRELQTPITKGHKPMSWLSWSSWSPTAQAIILVIVVGTALLIVMSILGVGPVS